jgi:tRNA(fMet)-specific endonuclease VapC
MSLYLLDTDILSLWQYGHPVVTARITAQPVADIALSTLTVQEEGEGWISEIKRAIQARNEPALVQAHDRLVRSLLPSWSYFAVLSFSQPAIARFQQLQALRLNVGRMDLCIAAVALVNGLIVVTRNRRDYGRVPGLVIQDWAV